MVCIGCNKSVICNLWEIVKLLNVHSKQAFIGLFLFVAGCLRRVRQMERFVSYFIK